MTPGPVGPVYLSPPRKPMTWAATLGIVLISSGALVGCFTGGIYACNYYNACLAPSDPAAPGAGVTTSPHGEPMVVLASQTAPFVTELEAFGSDFRTDGSGYPPPVWKIERTAPTPTWDGTLTIGEVPAGWRAVVPLTVPVGDVRGVLPSNGCYGASAVVPSTLPPAGTVVVDSDGETTSVADFRANWGVSVTPCPGSALIPPVPPEVWGSLGAVVAGVGLLVTTAIVRARRRAQAQ